MQASRGTRQPNRFVLDRVARPASLAAALAIWLASAPAAGAPRIVVHNGESIQAAIDAAPAGATIVVKPGVYHEAGATRAVTITQSGIRLVGQSRQGPVVLEQSGTQTQGIWVSPADSLDPADPELPPCGVSNQRIQGFHLRGFTVQGFAGFGVYLSCVDNFRIRKNTATANLTYAIFPVRSSHGRMSRNVVSGTINDACLYVGQDDTVVVNHNTASDCVIGFEIENSQHVRMAHNTATGNTAGILVDIVGNRQVTTISDNQVVRNTIENNNLPNPAPPSQDTSQIPAGIGLIVTGADQTLVSRNLFKDNGFTALTLLSPCVGDPAFCTPPLDFDPNPDMNRVVRNTFEGNALDVIYLPGDGQGNCFAKNKPAPLNVSGGPLPVCP